MLRKWEALSRHSTRQLQSGERRLGLLKQNMYAAQEACAQLQAEIDLQEQLERAGRLDGAAVDRQQLFTWLRKTAADKRRTQELRLELSKQQELGGRYADDVCAQKAVCRKLLQKCERYEEMVKAERRKKRMNHQNQEEAEIEERMSWLN